DTCHSHFVWHGNPEFIQRPQQVSGSEIICAYETVWADLGKSGLYLSLVVRFDAADIRLNVPLGTEDSFAVPGDASIHCRRRTRPSYKDNTPASAPQEVRCDRVSGSAVVDADKVVVAAIWVRDKI